MTQDLEALAARPITSRLREIMRDSQAMGESVNDWTPCVDAPKEQFEIECGIIDGAYSSLESLYAIACEVNDKQDRDNARLKTERDSALAELERVQSERPDLDGYLLLPKDADGEPIHAGDVLDGYGKTIEAVELRIGRSGWVIISRDGNGYADTFAFTHHHAPTVEDVLREFAVAISGQNEGFGALVVAEYADRLREVMRDGRD